VDENVANDRLTAIRLPGRAHRADELYTYLREAILDGTLPPDERLVEQRIAEVASVSRTPVREALHRLEIDGLVVSDGRGLVVIAHSVDELAELCTVREELEGLAARLGAVSRSELDLSALEQILAEMRPATTDHDVPRLIELNHLFHETIWQTARNRYLARQLEALRGLIERRDQSTLTDNDRSAQALQEHEAIYKAFVDSDANAAAEATRVHSRRGMAFRLMRLRERERANRER
jgi:DNA-binding GntR family transcriptional regulator